MKCMEIGERVVLETGEVVVTEDVYRLASPAAYRAVQDVRGFGGWEQVAELCAGQCLLASQHASKGP